MLRRWIDRSLRYRGVVVALALLGAVYGGYAASRAKLDVFPEFAPPRVEVQTEAPGLSPEQVEELVTRPVENAIQGSGSVETIRSRSVQGLSVVDAVFVEGTDLLPARQVVAERLAEIGSEIPEGVKPPALSPLTSATSTMLVIGLTSSKLTPMQLRTFADATLGVRLLGVPGVAKVNVFGGEVRRLEVRVDPVRLSRLGLALADVLDATRRGTGIRGAGFLEDRNQRIVVKPEGQAKTPEDLGAAVVRAGGAGAVRLRDVADVAFAPEPAFGDGRVLGEPGVVMVVSGQYGANTLEVTRRTEAALDSLDPVFRAEGIAVRPRMFRPASFIETAIRNVEKSLAIGALMVAFTLVLFLLDLRAAVISFSAIPLSLLAAVAVLEARGVSINTITLGGFAIAVGVVVDDAIVDVENIGRRLRENRALARPRSALDVVLDASLEVRGAVVYATFVVALVFAPVFGMRGVEGRLFAPLAEAFLLATMASLVVALTLTPALCLWLLPRDRARGEPRYVRVLKALHRRWLVLLSGRPRSVLVSALVLCAAGAAALPFLGGEFLPEFREGHFIVHMTLRSGASLAESVRLGRIVAKTLLADPYVRSVAQFAGRSEQGDDTWGTNTSEMNVDLAPSVDDVAAEDSIRRELARFPTADFEILPFLTERIEETISGETSEVVVKIFGDDLDRLEEKASEVTRVLGSIPGAVDVQSGTPPGAPQLTVRLRRDRLASYGIPPLDALETIQAAGRGIATGQTFEAGRVVPIAVRFASSAGAEPEALGDLLVASPDGRAVRLRDLAEIGPSDGRYSVEHEGGRRLSFATCNVRGRDLSSFVAEAKRRIADEIALPPGFYLELGGASQAQGRARRDLLVHSAAAAVAIGLLLFVVVGNARNLFLLAANLPFALVGGVGAVVVTGGTLSVGALVGFVTLFGISTRNSIMIVSHYQHLVEREGAAWGLETAIRGASERFVPVTMTAMVTFLALLPVALSRASAGHEIEGPMAVVILGGLVTSTLLNLFVLPALALRFGKFEPAALSYEQSGSTPAE